MTRGVNKVILVGNLGQAPDVKATNNGTTVVNLSLATAEQWLDKQTGNRQERTEWHRLVAFGKLADIMAQYLQKGSQIYVEGRLQTRKWQAQDGQDRYSTEVVVNDMQMLGGRQESNNHQMAQPNNGAAQGGYSAQQNGFHQERNQQQQQPRNNYQQPNNGGQQPPAFDDDIPF